MLLSVTILLHCLCIIHSWRNYEINFTGFHFEILDYDLIRNVTTTLQPYKQRNVLNGSFIFRQNINNFQVEVAGLVLRPQNEPIPLLDATFDGCETLASAFSLKNTNLGKIILKQLYRTKGYFPDRCPLLKDKPISLENFHFDPETFPPYMPDLNYTAMLHFLVDEHYIYKSYINSSVYTKKSSSKEKKRKPSKGKG